MAITQTVCTSFKQQLLTGLHNVDTDLIKIALYTDAATLGADTTAYTSDNEVSGTGYNALGVQIETTISTDGGIVFVDFADATWANSSFTARGALIYNDTRSRAAIMTLDFGDNKTSNNSTFAVTMPAGTSTTALLRIT